MIDEGNEITLPRKADKLDQLLDEEKLNQLKGTTYIGQKTRLGDTKYPSPWFKYRRGALRQLAPITARRTSTTWYK